MKKVLLILTIILAIAGLVLISGLSFLETSVRQFNQTQTVVADIRLKEISKQLGRDFTSSLALREYVYCELLKEGMTFEEVTRSLSEIGEIRTYSGSQVDFVDRYLYVNLSPIMLVFNGEKLVSWELASSVTFAVPKAYCEKK